ncbi:CAP domain-containing protein [Dietzia maris]|uniref:CAP domain-containing protein n=1 Tax=Dietzia maris TaxID=37915 RepID=UPI00223ACBE8|nr:CAP domain-containing protein [Dietzia maris]MCT1434479.1 CAP domain-containing protein [Dietzia maris]MCT1521560.1 CAP domain-containing protein [Dietzia maris]
MRTIVRRRIGAVAAAAATFLALAAPVTAAQSLQFTVGAPAPCEQATPAETEQVIADIHEYTNRERVAAGAKPVQRLESLEQIAQNWSEQMAAEDRMYHNPQIKALVADAYDGQWRSYGENVLQNWCGASGEALVQQWMNSLPHRLNLLNPLHTHLGVGVEVADSRKLYSTQNFVRLT